MSAIGAEFPVEDGAAKITGVSPNTMYYAVTVTRPDGSKYATLRLMELVHRTLALRLERR